MIYLKKFVLGVAKEKELKLHSFTEEYIRDVEREMENGEIKKTKEPITLGYVVEALKKIEQLKKGFGGDDWRAIEKEASKMIR